MDCLLSCLFSYWQSSFSGTNYAWNGAAPTSGTCFVCLFACFWKLVQNILFYIISLCCVLVIISLLLDPKCAASSITKSSAIKITDSAVKYPDFFTSSRTNKKAGAKYKAGAEPASNYSIFSFCSFFKSSTSILSIPSLTVQRSEKHTSELHTLSYLVCRHALVK